MTQITDEEFGRRAAELEWLLCDVDGVLTDGTLNYGPWGESFKAFHVHDGLGLKMAQAAGLKIGIFSARKSRALRRRARELSLDVVLTGQTDKNLGFEQFVERQATSARRVAYIGDDLTDLIVLGRCGLSFAPSNAMLEVRSIVHLVLSRSGGHGVVREMVEAILHARGDWEKVLGPFTFDAQ